MAELFHNEIKTKSPIQDIKLMFKSNRVYEISQNLIEKIGTQSNQISPPSMFGSLFLPSFNNRISSIDSIPTNYNRKRTGEVIFIMKNNETEQWMLVKTIIGFYVEKIPHVWIVCNQMIKNQQESIEKVASYKSDDKIQEFVQILPHDGSNESKIINLVRNMVIRTDKSFFGSPTMLQRK